MGQVSSVLDSLQVPNKALQAPHDDNSEDAKPVVQYDSPGVANQDQESEEEEKDPLASFAAIIDAIDLGALPAVAIRVRKELAERDHQRLHRDIEPAAIITPPLSGSNHVLYPIDFADGVRWLLKVPSVGVSENWDDHSAASIASEAWTMRLLRRVTTVPLPQVFDFATNLKSEINVPYILMEWIDGRSLYDLWFDKTISKKDLRVMRTRTLQDVANAMIQLSRFGFKRGGAITFDDAGTPSGMASIRSLDMTSMSARSDADASDHYVEEGPFDDYTSYYRCSLSRWQETELDWLKGARAVLKLVLDWLPECDPSVELPFVLTHPDFDMQNVLVSSDGHVKALIYWDGVCAVPRTNGYERYPAWLTRDWDPMMYGWLGGEATVETEQEVAEVSQDSREGEESGIKDIPEDPSPHEDSPATLAIYRKIYAGLVQDMTTRSASTESDERKPNDMITRQSPIFENLVIATSSEMSIDGIIEHLFGKIKEALDHDERDKLQYWEFGQSLVHGMADEGLVQLLHKGFDLLLAGHKGLI